MLGEIFCLTLACLPYNKPDFTREFDTVSIPFFFWFLCFSTYFQFREAELFYLKLIRSCLGKHKRNYRHIKCKSSCALQLIFSPWIIRPKLFRRKRDFIVLFDFSLALIRNSGKEGFVMVLSSSNIVSSMSFDTLAICEGSVDHA